MHRAKPRFYLLALLALAATACHARRADTHYRASSNAPPESAQTADTALADRAHRYWRARRDNDWAALYDFEPQAVRARTDLASYTHAAQQRRPVEVAEFDVRSVEAAGPFGWARVRHKSSVPQFPDIAPKEMDVWQKWRRIDGVWYPVPPDEVEVYPAAPAERETRAEPALRRRFLHSWELRVSNQYELLYTLTDPRDREEVSEAEFLDAENRIDYLSHELQWLEVVDDRGRVRLVYRYKLNDPSLTKMPPATTQLIEHWVKRDGDWYLDLIRP